MNQSEIEYIHTEIIPVLELYINGLITDWELAVKMREVANRMDNKISGLLDPNTGLRYP